MHIWRTNNKKINGRRRSRSRTKSRRRTITRTRTKRRTRLRGRTRRRRRRKRRRRRRKTTTTRGGEEINSTVGIEKAFNVFLDFPTGHKRLTYSENWLTVNEMTFPSNRGSVSSLSVISIHSRFSRLDRMRTRATDISMSFL